MKLRIYSVILASLCISQSYCISSLSSCYLLLSDLFTLHKVLAGLLLPALVITTINSIVRLTAPDQTWDNVSGKDKLCIENISKAHKILNNRTLEQLQYQKYKSKHRQYLPLFLQNYRKHTY